MSLLDKIIEEAARRYAAALDTVPNLNIKIAYEAGVRHGMATGWLSCAIDGNPEDPGPYWVYRMPVEGKHSQHPMSVRMWDGERWASSQNVTHWRYLPEHPKE